MGQTMKVLVRDNKAYVYTPYNPDFVNRMHGIGGARWDGQRKCWVVPEDSIVAVRVIMKNVYGYTDLSPDRMVKLKVTFHDAYYCDRSPVVLYGKVLSYATESDSNARLGEDVCLIEGSICSAGSAKNWKSGVTAGSVFILNKVSNVLYETAKPPKGMSVTIEKMDEGLDRTALEKERERLFKRIGEIDAILGRKEERP